MPCHVHACTVIMMIKLRKLNPGRGLGQGINATMTLALKMWRQEDEVGVLGKHSRILSKQQQQQQKLKTIISYSRAACGISEGLICAFASEIRIRKLNSGREHQNHLSESPC